MYCPECGGEYRKEITICPTCEVALTPAPQAASGPWRSGATGREMEPRVAPFHVDLVHFAEETEARAARKRLREAGVPSELVIRDGDPAEDGEPVEEFWIRVPGAAVRVAADVLELGQELNEEVCPGCGAPFDSTGICRQCAE